jgi:hypothetical protein
MSLAILTLPPTFAGSTISAGRLNGRVRDGNGCFPSAMIARDSMYFTPHKLFCQYIFVHKVKS